jgi:photosystem II stability/assembly factor-like uncharacterized protein
MSAVMKKVFFILALLLTISKASAQWSVQPSLTGYLSGIYFVDSLKGWVCSHEGLLWKTTNGGLTWDEINLGFSNSFFGIYFIDENTGWIIGSDGLLLKTTDGGQIWNQLNIGTSYGLFDIFFIDENNGWIATGTINNSQVLKTTDGGQSWNEYTNGIDNNITIFFKDSNNGWVGGWGPNLSRTTDGGITWELQYSGTNSSRMDIFFVNESIGWIFGNPITKTTDGGNSWFVISQFGGSTVVNSGIFLNENVGWICGSESGIGKILKTTNGGITWVEEFSVYNKPLYEIFFLDSQNGWVIGMDGFIAKYDTTKYINVLSPNGGEQWLSGNSYNITWQKNNVELISLYYSTNSGQDWLLIEENVQADNLNYWWDSIPNTPSENCLVKIIDENDPNIFDMSDSTFSIIFNPQINITLPNGGESLARGGTFTIKWGFQQLNKFNILYSLDGGVNWISIINNLNWFGNNGEYDWNVPDTTSEQCLIKIESSLNPAIFDVSDQYFRIIDIPPFSYFPLNVGNIWYFSEGHDGVIKYKVEVEKDTLLDDNNTYAKLRQFYTPHDSLLYVFFLRKENNKIIRYPEYTILDFQMDIGDPATSIFEYPYPSVLTDINLVNVFGRYLSTYYFFTTPYDYYSYTDSIGFNTWGADTWTNYFPKYLLGCIIDGVSYGLVSVEEENKSVSVAFQLSQNYPNPFNPSTVISYQLPVISNVTLKVYDILGREVAVLVNEEKPAGSYEIQFTANGLTSGIYFYQINTGNFSETKKMILLR